MTNKIRKYSTTAIVVNQSTIFKIAAQIGRIKVGRQFSVRRAEVHMRIIGLISVHPNANNRIVEECTQRIMAGEATGIPDLDFLGPCVHWGFSANDIKKFLLDDIDIDSLTSQLIEARKQGRFKSWFLAWDLVDENAPPETGGLRVDGLFVMNNGYIYEDKETGAIVNHPGSTFLRNQIERQKQ